MVIAERLHKTTVSPIFLEEFSSPPEKPTLNTWQEGTLHEILLFVKDTFDEPSLTISTLITFLADRNLYITVERSVPGGTQGGTIVEANKHMARIGIHPDIPSSRIIRRKQKVSFKFFEDHGNEIFPSWKKKTETATDQS